MYTPLNYQQINIAAGTNNPSSVKTYNNKSFAYWERSLFQRIQSVIDWTLPEAWEGKTRDFFLYCLFKYGYLAVSENAEFGYFFQPCGVSGYNFYYQPTDAIISNPLYQGTLKIGTECELLKLTPDYTGAWDIIWYFAEKLSLLDNAINMSLINCKIPFILGAKNKAIAQALKKILDQVNKGEPAVFYDSTLMNDPKDKDTPFQLLEIIKNPKDFYITDKQLQDFQGVLNEFDAEIGIPGLPYQKKERMVAQEATMRTYDGCARSQTWINTLTSSIAEIKKLYPDITLDAKLHYDVNNDGIIDGEEVAADE